jgi:hypothetical protein
MKLITILLLSWLSGFPVMQTSQDIPTMNMQIVKYVESVMGTQVDRGECWDIAYQALTLTNAKWDGMYKYGKAIDYKKEPVYPGDIIHFKGVVVKQTVGFTTTTETMEEHTAIILKVYDKGVFELAHQNTSFSGRKVGTSPIDLSGVTKGKVTIYRPVK